MQNIQKAEEIVAHKMIADLAVQMAHETYEQCASHYNNWYKVNPSRTAFVKRCAPTLVEEARRVLAQLLDSDKLPREEKDKIFEALLMDASIPGNATRGKYEKIVI